MNVPIIDYTPCYQAMEQYGLHNWSTQLPPLVEEALAPTVHGDVPKWLKVLQALPLNPPSLIDLDRPTLQIGQFGDLSPAQEIELRKLLMQFQPWRKGPFNLFGIEIDTEWRSDWKWKRLERSIRPLAGRRILDVGSGNGYYGWRMIGAGAELVIGIDPTLRYLMQYAVINHFLRLSGSPCRNYVLPLRLQHLTKPEQPFDTVFSMGVIYHQRDHMLHLQQLMHQLRPGGELILEGLVIDAEGEKELKPKGRYAKMHNVHSIPSPLMMQRWLEDSGFEEVTLLDHSATTHTEQRRTPWMIFESLADFIHPDEPQQTIEGHPSPERAIFSAIKPIINPF